jgi:hypothetical protein
LLLPTEDRDKRPELSVGSASASTESSAGSWIICKILKERD